MFEVPRKIIEVDLYEMEARFLAYYLGLYGCETFEELEVKFKKEDLCQNEIV